jgi:hypothetical protein
MIKTRKISHPGILDILEGQETGKVNHLAELSEVVNTGLDFLQAVAHGVTLESDLEKRVAHGALEEEKIGHGADLEAKSNRKDGPNTIVTAGTQKQLNKRTGGLLMTDVQKGGRRAKVEEIEKALFFRR